MKSFIITFIILLVICFTSLFFIAADEEGMFAIQWVIAICKAINSLFKFPLFTLEKMSGNEIFNGSMYYVSYIANTIFWSLIFNYIFKLIRKK